MILADSSETQFFKISYQLQLYVKHDSKLEFGQGNSVGFHIAVKSPPQQFPEMGDKEQ